MLTPDTVPTVVKTGASTRVASQAVTPRFKPGDRVVARNMNPIGHTRLPRYVRGRHGVIHHDHGVFVFPDTSAHGEGDKPQHVYSVRFERPAPLLVAVSAALFALYVGAIDQGHLLAFVQGQVAFDQNLLHELVHDARHVAGFPCH